MTDSTPFSCDYTFEYGVAEKVAPGLRRIVANNPSPYTFKGTNTYIIGRGAVAVIDPGPDSEIHAAAIMAALAANSERVSYIILTHGHKDHCGGLARLATLTGAEVLGAGALAGANLQDGQRIVGGDWELEAIHTPGHAPDHMCFSLNSGTALLSGDHVMGWNTTVIAPPEGNMANYLRSLEMLITRREDLYFPGHGGHVEQGRRLARALIMHRRWREAQILDCLRQGHASIESIVPRIYEDLAENLETAAAYAVLGHLDMMVENGIVIRHGQPGLHAQFLLSDAL
jgi:glyoxylase-like metal-dependent hydrolase (beta-lactamase superfamily II)